MALSVKAAPGCVVPFTPTSRRNIPSDAFVPVPDSEWISARVACGDLIKQPAAAAVVDEPAVAEHVEAPAPRKSK